MYGMVVSIFLFSGLLSGFFFLWHLPTIDRKKGSLEREIKLSVIVPVRNEEKSLPNLLKSLKQQTFPIHEIIVVDDDSIDRTVSVAEAFDVTVLSVKKSDLEAEGKSAGCWVGASYASGNYFLFLDADTVFVKPDALRAVLAEYEKNGNTGLFSIQPYHETKFAYETLSIVPNIIVLAGLNRFTCLKGKLPERGAFGPFLLVKKEEYEKVGGHKAISDSHMDDIEMAKLYQKNKLSVKVFGGRGSVHFRMFPEGIKQLVQGWTKSLIQGAEGTHPLVLLAVGLWIGGNTASAGLLVYALIQGRGLLLLIGMAFYLLYCGQFRWLSNKIGRFPLWAALFPTVYIAVFLCLYLWAWIQVTLFKKVKWRDRDIHI